MSNVYFARPVTFSGPSSRITEVPRMAGFSGHAYFLTSSGLPAGATGACGRPAAPPPRCLATGHHLCGHRRFFDADERPAAADVAVESPADLFFGRPRIFFEKGDGRHDEARRAEAAHQRVDVAEGLLHRMQRVAGRQSFNGANLFALDVDGQ